jgi:methylglyoxal/glyoxal reductase
MEDYAKGNVAVAVEKQLKQLQTTYIDLYMLHSPGRSDAETIMAWRQLETLLKQGVVRSIGVSNFDIRQLELLRKRATVQPMYVQNKLSIYHSNGQGAGDDELKYCREQGIVLMAYSTLSGYPYKLNPVKDAFVAHIAKKKGVSGAQVLLRWALQMGAGVIPRSSKAGRIASNLDLFSFELSAHEMQLLNSCQHLLMSSRNVRQAIPSVFDTQFPDQKILTLHDLDTRYGVVKNDPIREALHTHPKTQRNKQEL